MIPKKITKISQTDLRESSFREDIIKKPLYWVCVGFITVLSYLFDITNRTIGIDDLARSTYSWAGKAMIKGTRWAMNIWDFLFTSSVFSPFIDKFLAAIFLILNGLIFSRILFNYIRHNHYKLTLCILFSCLYISFPLINEIWNYNGANYITEGNSFLAAFTVFLLHQEEKIVNKKTLLCSFLLTMIAASYEASAFMYITLVLSVLLLDYLLLNRRKWIQSGMRYALPLLAAILLRYAIGFSILKLLNLNYEPNGMTGILWNFKNSLWPQVKSLIITTFDHYFLRALIYLPITIFVISLITSFICIFIVSLKKKNFVILLIYFLLCVSLFAQAILQGTNMPYRTAQTIHLFTPLALTMSLLFITYYGRRSLTVFFIACVGLICYRQGFFMNQTLSLNNQRSENEAFMAQSLGFRLKTDYPEKPIYFIGLLDLGDNINQRVRPDENTPGGYLYRKLSYHFDLNYLDTRLYESNVNSVMSWNSLGSQMMVPYFAYYGYDINVLENISTDLYRQIVHYVLKEEMKPFEIRDMGSYILVYLGLRSW